MKTFCGFVAVLAVTHLLHPKAAQAQLNIPSDGSDGALVITSDTVVDLSDAVSGVWSDNNSANAGKGIYDSNQWAVVFKFSNVSISAGARVTFKNHPSRAPVVWLATGAVNIDGIIRLDGAAAGGLGPAEGGPGGFRGCIPPPGTAVPGFGPGGGLADGGAGSYGTRGAGNSGPTYGSAAILPLLGGSGGSSRFLNYFTCHDLVAGGGGGGAILIAAPGSIVLNGQLSASGGEPLDGCFSRGAGGSGGAIRLLANSVSGRGTIRALGGAQSGGDGRLTGGDGRIRIEANAIALADLGLPNYVPALPTDPPSIWPSSDAPTLRIVGIDERPVRDEPRASFAFPQDVILERTNAVRISIAALNVSTNWNIKVRVVPPSRPEFTVVASLVEVQGAASKWEAFAAFPPSVSILQALAIRP